MQQVSMHVMTRELEMADQARSRKLAGSNSYGCARWIVPPTTARRWRPVHSNLGYYGFRAYA